jgi:hypothetical protein
MRLVYGKIKKKREREREREREHYTAIFTKAISATNL